MNHVFIPVVVALTGLFGLAFALYGVLTTKRREGRQGKQPSNQPTAVPPPGVHVKLISRGRTHTASVSLV